MKLIYVFFIILLFNGCFSHSNTHSISQKNKMQNITKFDSLPHWITDPNKPNQLCAIGIVKNSNDLIKKAFLKAKVNISNQIEALVNSQSYLVKQCRNDTCNKSFKRFITIKSISMLNNIKIIDNYIDNKNNIYYVHACTMKDNDEFIYNKKEYPHEVTKRSCIYQSNYPHKTIDEQKKILISNSKKEAVNELYGELISSITQMNNGIITSEKIKQEAIGSVRTKGDPIFFQGENLGEICSDVTSYITDEDLVLYKPTKVKLNHICYVGKSINIDDLKRNAKYKAYQEITTKFEPSLKLSDKESEKYIHHFLISNDKFDFDTQSYCFDAEAIVFPYELILKNDTLQSENSINIKSGLIATFYDQNDFDMKNPLYQTHLSSLDLQYQKLPFNDNIIQNKAYLIKINGYVKSDSSQLLKLKLYENVYSLNLFLNHQKVLTRLNNEKNIQLNKGLNKLSLIVKTANGYDFRIVGLNNFYTKSF